MPAVVNKKMTLWYMYCQPRRIVCDSCGKPFVYAATGKSFTETTGLPVLSSDKGMREAVTEAAVTQAARIGNEERLGEAQCPNCRCYQDWMVAASQSDGCAFAIAFAGVMGLVVLTVVLLGYNSGNWLILLGLAIVASAVVGYVLGRRQAIAKGPHHGQEDARSWADEDYLAFLKQCELEQLDSAHAMHVHSGAEQLEGHAFIGLPMRDETDEPLIVPADS